MLCKTEASPINRINAFLRSPEFVALAALLTAAANLFSLELAVYTVFTLVVVYVCLLGDDLRPIMPLVVFCYLAPSVANNPGYNAASVFSGGTGVYILCLGGVIALAVGVYVFRNRRSFFRHKRPLLGGMLLLAGAYMLSGIGSAAYPDAAAKNLFFAFLQGACIIVPYYLFSGGLDWKHTRKDYFAWVGFCAGGLLVIEILWIYLTGNVTEEGVIIRQRIYTGWGMYNNMGGMLAMMIPFAFYLATKYHKGWIGTVVGSAFFVCILLTCSRNSIITATAVYIVCILLMLSYARNRRHNTIALVTVSTVLILTFVLFHDQILLLFSDLLDRGLDPSSRDYIYWEGLKLFAEAPIFGSSFYSPGYQPWDFSIVDSFSSFFPPRWHNTVIQLLASCGVVGLCAYILHRVQTVRMLLCGHSKEKAFIACSLGVLVVCSLFDCHFFNIGPTLFYSMALAFGENCSGNLFSMTE